MTRTGLTSRLHRSRDALLRRATFALAAVLATAPAAAGGVHRVADVHPGPANGGTQNWLWQADFEPFGGKVYFTSNDGIHGNELWVTDGTPAGTTLFADICPGACPSHPLYLTAVGDRLLFRASDGARGNELWATDGTPAGTGPVVDLVPGIGGSQPSGLTAFGDRVLFAASSPDRPRTLWSSDGTAAGTTPIGGTDPATTPTGPIPFTVLDGLLVFAASTPAHGSEPWVTDGTPAGTIPLGDLRPGTGGSLNVQEPHAGFESFAVLDDLMVFVADDGTTGDEVWSTDGTPAGTARLKDIDPGPSPSFPGSFEACNGKVFFRADDGTHGRELWTTDGTPANTAMVVDAAAGIEGSSPWEMTCAGDRVFYQAGDPDHGQEPWMSDGTAEGTGMIVDLQPGPDSSVYFFALPAVIGNRVTFFADDGTTGSEPWVTDGTAAGTRLLEDINVGPSGSSGGWGTIAIDRREVFGGEWYFRAFSLDAGFELWISDGTPASTRMIEINRQSSAFEVILSRAGLSDLQRPAAIADHDGTVFFQADDGIHGTELWHSDGTAAGTALVRDLDPGFAHSHPRAIRSAEHGVIFSAGAEQCCGGNVWVSDGTPAGTLPVEHLGDIPEPEFAARLGDHVYFTDYPGGLWRSDGTVAGTEEVAGADYPGGVARVGEWIYFADGELWRTDGVIIEQVADILPGSDASEPHNLVAGDHLLYFTADDGVHGRELWVSDGSADGTRLARDVRLGPDSGVAAGIDSRVFGATSLAVAGDRAFFLADDGTTGEELWTSDGTEAGTVLLRDVFPGPRSSEILWLTAVGDRAYFVAEDGVHGRELWTSEGAPESTFLLADLVPGPGSSLPEQLAAVDGRLYFSAHTPAFGRELWSSDGTLAGTSQVDDVAPGPLPSSPMGFTRAGDGLYFAATDGETGFELYRLFLPGTTVFADGFESGDTTVWTSSAP